MALADNFPWQVHPLGGSPWLGFWAFNPSIVRIPRQDLGDRWLVSLRCANYHLPGSGAQPTREVGPIINRTLIRELDPRTWQVIDEAELVDASPAIRSEWARALGFEDLRLVYTDVDGLCATASAMRMETSTIEIVAMAIEQCADQHNYKIVHVTPLRGPWSTQHQKNWSPFVGAPALRALYSPLGGGIHTVDGRAIETHAAQELPRAALPRMALGAHERRSTKGAIELTVRQRYASAPMRPTGTRLQIRGGTQLVPRGKDYPGRWIGLGHGCEVGFAKYYWHHFYEVDDYGQLLAVSDPIKLSPAHGIEFAAGMAVTDNDDLVITYGIEDDSAHLAITPKATALELLSRSAESKAASS